MTEGKNLKQRKEKSSSPEPVKESEKKTTLKSENKACCKGKCEKDCCCGASLLKLIIIALMGVLLYYQSNQISKASKIITDLNTNRESMCQNFKIEKSKEKPHYSQDDLLRYFAVSFEGGVSPENEWMAKFIESQNIYNEERYTSDAEEMKRRENLYGPYIERGFKDDDRFYIKLSSPEVGYGLFAKTDIPAGSVIGVYGGVLSRVKGNGVTDTDYSWSYQNYDDPETGEKFEVCIDGRVHGTWLRFVNHKHDSEANLYGMYVPYKNRWYLMYHARNFIAKDEELFTSYGDFYWDARKDSHHFEAEPDQNY